MRIYRNVVTLALTLCLTAAPCVFMAASVDAAESRTAESVLAELEARHQQHDTAAAAEAAPAQAEEDQASQSQAETAKQAEPKKAQKQKKAKTRYVELLHDNGFVYCLDKQNARWVELPHSGNEYVADVWIRLNPDGTQTETARQDSEGNYQYAGQTYYLEHYYIRPKTQQIQFLCELEVTGRPDNAIKERAYSAQNWENLVPGSIEDDIYHAVLKNMQRNRLGSKSSGGKSIRDIIEDTVNISL